MSAKNDSTALRAGFSLIEAMVALVVAGLFLPVLGRAFVEAGNVARVPGELLPAVALARAALQASPDAAAGSSSLPGYALTRSTSSIDVVEEPSPVAPPPILDAHKDAPEPDPSAVPAGMRLAEPAGLAAAAAQPRLTLRQVRVVVRAPSGRRFTLDSVRLDDAAP